MVSHTIVTKRNRLFKRSILSLAVGFSVIWIPVLAVLFGLAEAILPQTFPLETLIKALFWSSFICEPLFPHDGSYYGDSCITAMLIVDSLLIASIAFFIFTLQAKHKQKCLTERLT